MSTATAVEPDAQDTLRPPFEASGEFVDGVWMERTMGNEAAEIASELHIEMGLHNRQHRLGHIVGSVSGFQYPGLANGHRRHPDAAFIRKDKVPGDKLSKGWDAFPPTVVVEVVSPHDTAGEVEKKIEEWLSGGVERVWVVYPESEHIAVHYPDLHSVTLTETGTLDGEDVFPGFRMKVASIFPPFPRDEA